MWGQTGGSVEVVVGGRLVLLVLELDVDDVEVDDVLVVGGHVVLVLGRVVVVLLVDVDVVLGRSVVLVVGHVVVLLLVEVVVVARSVVLVDGHVVEVVAPPYASAVAGTRANSTASPSAVRCRVFFIRGRNNSSSRSRTVIGARPQPGRGPSPS